MGNVSTPLDERARSIFVDLGYSVEDAGGELSAVRDWKEIRVQAVAEGVDAPTEGGYRCFVTWDHHADALADTLDEMELDCEWAVIGVREDDGGGYEVARAPSARQ